MTPNAQQARKINAHDGQDGCLVNATNDPCWSCEKITAALDAKDQRYQARLDRLLNVMRTIHTFAFLQPAVRNVDALLGRLASAGNAAHAALGLDPKNPLDPAPRPGHNADSRAAPRQGDR